MSLEVGLKGTAEVLVDMSNTASTVGSGGLPVFSTPSMVALMETAAAGVVAPLLDEGRSTVGTRLDITHDAPTPVGMKVRAEATLEEIDGKRLVFRVEAFDDDGRIGGGTHERYIISAARFMEKTAAKLKKE
jgi:predicted thioesterase